MTSIRLLLLSYYHTNSTPRCGGVRGETNMLLPGTGKLGLRFGDYFACFLFLRKVTASFKKGDSVTGKHAGKEKLGSIALFDRTHKTRQMSQWLSMAQSTHTNTFLL